MIIQLLIEIQHMPLQNSIVITNVKNVNLKLKPKLDVEQMEEHQLKFLLENQDLVLLVSFSIFTKVQIVQFLYLVQLFILMKLVLMEEYLVQEKSFGIKIERQLNLFLIENANVVYQQRIENFIQKIDVIEYSIKRVLKSQNIKRKIKNNVNFHLFIQLMNKINQ